MRLKELRKSKNISQLKLAMDLNTNQNTISRYETNEREPGINELIKIADYFNVSVDYLMTGKANEFSKEMALTDVKLSNMTLELKEYALKLAALPEDKQKQIMSLIDMLER